jgi:hypothetical protein
MVRLLIKTLLVLLVLAAAGLGFIWWYDHVGQKPDPSFHPRSAAPAFVAAHPRVLIDQAHRNFHTMDGRYKPLAELLSSDGYRVEANRQPFTAGGLRPEDILVVSNAMGPGRGEDKPAFTAEEEDALLAWVTDGGSLLLIADHAPFGAAAERLAKRFGIAMYLRFARDDRFKDGWDNERLLFSRANGLLADHAITRGRNAAERVGTVVSFTGQSLSGPANCRPLLKLGPDAYDWESRRVRYPARGHAEALACEIGRGRLVVTGEAAMFSAQVDPLGFKFGMNRAGNDDRQFALNILHWLSRLL